MKRSRFSNFTGAIISKETSLGLFVSLRLVRNPSSERFPTSGNDMKFSLILHSRRAGFTLLEVMLSLAIIGALLVTLLYTLNYHLGIAERHGVVTVSMGLAKEKLYEMEKGPSSTKGNFPEPYRNYTYETSVKDSSFPGMTEISVTVKNGKEEITLSELMKKAK